MSLPHQIFEPGEEILKSAATDTAPSRVAAAEMAAIRTIVMGKRV